MIDFTFQGEDEGDLISGRGEAVINNENLDVVIFIHCGDVLEFTGEPVISQS